MTAHRAANWLLAILIAAALSTAWLDGPSFEQAEADTAADVEAAQAQARAAASCGGDVANCRAAYKRPRIAYSEGAGK